MVPPTNYLSVFFNIVQIQWLGNIYLCFFRIHILTHQVLDDFSLLNMIMRRTQCVLAIVVLLLFSSVQCHNNFTDLIAPLYTQIFYNQLWNLTYSLIRNDITDTASFCIRDPVFDWDQTFNFSSNLTFLTSCALKSNADILRHVCTPAEVKLYFMSLFKRESESTNYLKLNKNCNRTSWFAGCEPGWACSAGSNVEFGHSYSKDIPARTLDCQACCEGFFCPHGFACMIPCPFGSYCPLATLNKTTGICEPYRYQLPPGRPNHTCGGANIWADVGSSSEVFCSAGSYCPSNIQKTSCSSGHYCRKGSISEKRCFKLSSCDPNTANQDIHAYGIILIAALSTLLLTIYNCYDRVLTIREMRNAKARKAAARSAREKAQARDKYKSAKNAAKKPKIASPSQLSLASCKKTVIHPQALESLGQTKAETDDDLDSSLYVSALNSPEQSSHAVEDDPDSCNAFSLELGDKNTDRKMKNEKQIRTHSEIFQYAYAQLEKEKALLHLQQNKNLTFSGLISMATSQEIRKRPMIEVSFRDLSLTLKGKNKRLLRCVTGKIMPGHITAVMGTSGAGKTTLISALAGKTVGCKMTGLILINGKPESIHSYRKIIGFVPQDDIVHGNLTVEENLWFSARCRLSADLPKPDKVLIVERVIELLGLQAVRDSLVGTVEKRRISGGERKRVNVGLELVMEPSLLILDEPTSGLDSSTSQLLLRALRREALEGVNICMVVHQPSYTLFKMFDDLILLKAGLTVYHGPVSKVEEYFAGLGINVPEHMNPTDHFIDVLEEIVKPITSLSINYRELPMRWMLHKGYPVPPDMQQDCAGLVRSSTGVNLDNQKSFVDAENKEQSFAGEIWKDMICTLELHWDIIQHNILRSRDLSNRRTPGVLMQYKYFLGRVGKQRLREARLIAVDLLILLLAGACVGSLTKTGDENFGVSGYIHTIIAVSLLCKIAALRTFSLDKLQYWRESASGICSLAHFLSKETIDHFNTVIKPVVYLSMFYSFSNPRSSFADNYIVLLCLVYCVTGIGYALSIFLGPGPAQLCAVLLPVVLALISIQIGESKFVKKLANLSYPRWALEAFVIANAERYSGVWLITRCGVLMEFGFNIHDWDHCISSLILLGIFSRLIAFFGMVAFLRK